MMKVRGSELSNKYLENGGNEFIFWFAASKQCLVKKGLDKETEHEQWKVFSPLWFKSI